ncbi:MAG: imidazolonepropionase [Alphaproteobacteria bacterium]|nr:imidazolonepropionase [Alphaproteobacteria bacterium]
MSRIRVLTDCHIATMTKAPAPYGAIRDGALVIEGQRIAWVGSRSDIPRAYASAQIEALEGRWLTPALIDAHTHAVFGGTRIEEFEARSAGASYQALAAAGGGILSTVRATRDASEDELVASAVPRLKSLAADGVGRVEIKSGYGLDAPSELKMLRAARRAGDLANIKTHKTFLGLHALPPEWRNSRREFIRMMGEDVLPAAAREGLAESVDAYCEVHAFTPEEIAQFFDAAVKHGLKVKLHADQMSDLGGAALAARYGALSADHLEYTSEEGVDALARAKTVAVLLPGAFYMLRETRRPPVAALRAAGVPIALGSDLNPGTAPVASLLTIMNMAVILFGLTPEEALSGVTREAAKALGVAHCAGTIAPGNCADLAVWDINHPAELCYWLGRRLCQRRIIDGVDQSTVPARATT